MDRRVLVVDDNAETVKVIQEALERAGFSVVSAQNGAECLAAVDEQQPDLVILDVHMPVLNGLDALRLLRQRPDMDDLPVIILSGKDEYTDVRAGWGAGADLYLTKPVRLGAVVAAARWVLGDGDRPDAVLAGVVSSDL
jgi:DNA-binding response OmpR family regulator